MLGLAYSAAAVSGVDNIPEDWPEGVQELIREMTKFRNDCALPIIPLAAQQRARLKYIQSFLYQLPEETPEQLLASFRDEDKQAITEWTDLRAANYRSEDIPQSAVKYFFPSLEVAAIELCTGRYLEHRWEETVMAGLSCGITVSFVVVDVDLVLAVVIYQARKQSRRKTQLSDHMTIQTEVEVDDVSEDEQVIKAKGKLASTRIGVGSDFCVLLEKPSRDVFSIASKYGKEPAFMLARVTIEENDRVAKLEVKAVNRSCQEGDNLYDQFQATLPAEDAARAPSKNFLVDDVGCSQHHISTITDAVIAKLIKVGKAPNPEQTAILRNAGLTKVKFKRILGPPGTGKATTIAALTEIYARCPKLAYSSVCHQMETLGESMTPRPLGWPSRRRSSTAIPTSLSVCTVCISRRSTCSRTTTSFATPRGRNSTRLAQQDS